MPGDDILTRVNRAKSASWPGDADSAIHLYLTAIDARVQVDGEMPLRLVGRLAALYRRCGRYEDEVTLLLRFHETRGADSTERRYDARLTKAMALADRGRRTESGALLSVRRILQRNLGTSRSEAAELVQLADDKRISDQTRT